jgi:cytochrome P450
MPYPHLVSRLKNDLPVTAPLPSALQTLGCRLRPHDYFQACRRRYGPRFTIYPFGMPPLVVLSDPAEICATLTAPAHVLHPGAGAHLTTAFYGPRSFILCDEEAHRAGRAAIMPAFRRSILQTSKHIQIVTEIAARETAFWPQDTPFAVHPYLRALTLRVILRTMFGEETALLSELHRRILDLPAVTASLVIQQPLLRHLPGWHRTWRLYQHQRRDVYQITRAILSERRRSHSKSMDLFEMLFTAHDEHDVPMSEDQALDHLVSLMIAGHETTAGQLAWALQLLAHHPHTLQRLLQEIDTGTENSYLTAVIQETMRHRCVFLFTMPRKVVQPIQIGERIYTPPTHLLGAIHLLHHDQSLFADPEIFEPQRFLEVPPRSHTWLPWGGGRRRCPGQHLALQEMQITLRVLLAHRAIRPAGPELERGRWRNAIIVPHNDCRIVLNPRQR